MDGAEKDRITRGVAKARFKMFGRECPFCRRWFKTIFSRKIYCSEDCRNAAKFARHYAKVHGLVKLSYKFIKQEAIYGEDANEI